MKSFLLIAALLLAGGARAQSMAPPSEPARWGVGLMLGAPTGLTVKRWLGGREAFDLGFGGAYGPGVRFWGDYIFGLARIPADTSNVSLDLYLGVGPMVGVYSGPCAFYADYRCGGGNAYVGGRVPFGIEAVFRKTPLAVGFELAPGIAIASPGIGGTFDLAFTARFLL